MRGAGAVRKLGFVTVRALAGGDRCQMIVGATESRALLGVSPFGICHCKLPFQFAAAGKRPRTLTFRPQALLQFLVQIAQGRPTRVAWAGGAPARLLIAVCAAYRALPRAGAVAPGAGTESR